jgi:hypothetical protein
VAGGIWGRWSQLALCLALDLRASLARRYLKWDSRPLAAMSSLCRTVRALSHADARFEPVSVLKDVKRRFLAAVLPSRSPDPHHLAVLARPGFAGAAPALRASRVDQAAPVAATCWPGHRRRSLISTRTAAPHGKTANFDRPAADASALAPPADTVIRAVTLSRGQADAGSRAARTPAAGWSGTR